MSTIPGPSDFRVNIILQAAGPVRPRTKYKENKLLRAEGSISLPFVPYPGLYLTFSKRKKRGTDLTLYLRIRAVEWNVAENHFECVADEVLLSPVFDEMMEVRGSARIELHFQELTKKLRAFSFDVDDNAENLNVLSKWEDGTVKEAENAPLPTRR